MKILILNGPNLNLLGKREPGIYGSASAEDIFNELKQNNPSVTFTYFQSNVEGELVNKLHEVGFDYDGIVFNAGEGKAYPIIFRIYYGFRYVCLFAGPYLIGYKSLFSFFIDGRNSR